MASIETRALLVKSSFNRLLSSARIERMAHRLGYRWRARQLGPAVTIHLWIMQIVMNNLSMAGARHLLREAVSAAGICRAKKRVPLELLRRLNRDLIDRLRCRGERGLWRGHRVLGGDCVTYYTPDTPQLRQRFGSKKPFGYPLGKVLTLFELAGGMMLHQILMPHNRQEAPLVRRLLRHLLPDDLLVLDRAFASFLNFWLAGQARVHLLIRLKKNLWAGGGFRRTLMRRLGPGDFLVRWRRPRDRSSLLSLRRWKRLPGELTLRQITVKINRRGFRSKRIVLITTLLDPKIYPADEIAQLYARRWEVETNFRHLKQTLNLEHLRCKSVVGVRKELMIRALAYNLVRAAMQHSAELLKVSPQRISFIDTLRWLLLGSDPDGIARMVINPKREDRIEPRRLKRQKKNYLPLNCTRAQARLRAA